MAITPTNAPNIDPSKKPTAKVKRFLYFKHSENVVAYLVND
jgi:hypothetical protein